MVTMALLLASLLIGVLFGLLLHKLFGRTANDSKVQAENESLRLEIETLRSQVDGHFATSAVMFQNLTEEYRKLLQHMADGARSLDVELPGHLLADFSAAASLPEPSDEPGDEPGADKLSEQPSGESMTKPFPADESAAAADDAENPTATAADKLTTGPDSHNSRE
ncbi:MAG: DUF1043 family protein [Immundisolibacteraceae bacterium]|nr:DUF1043 family protein [Immundisolibacteraceae bacterium]